MKNTQFYFLFWSAILFLTACVIPTPQTLIPAPSIRNIRGGIEIIPNQPGTMDKNGARLNENLAKSVKVTIIPLGKDLVGKSYEKTILPGEPLKIIQAGSFETVLRYLDGDNKVISVFQQTQARDLVTWDIVVIRPVNTVLEADRCNCPASATTLSTDPACPSARSFTWGPSTATNLDTRRIQVTNPTTGASATFIVYMTESGDIRLLTRSGNSQLCLTEIGFCLSDDNKMIQFDTGSLFFSLKSNLNTTALVPTLSQKLTIFCPAAYVVTVQKLNCSTDG